MRRNAIRRKQWRWFGTAGHHVCRQKCRFHLCTAVGDYLISTIGEYVICDVIGDGEQFFADVGSGRKYETYVFLAGAPCTQEDCQCGLPEIDGVALDTEGYNQRGAATAGHMRMCIKWAKAAAVKQEASA